MATSRCSRTCYVVSKNIIYVAAGSLKMLLPLGAASDARIKPTWTFAANSILKGLVAGDKSTLSLEVVPTLRASQNNRRSWLRRYWKSTGSTS